MVQIEQSVDEDKLIEIQIKKSQKRIDRDVKEMFGYHHLTRSTSNKVLRNMISKRLTMTVMVIDLVGSTKLSAEIHPMRYSQVHNRGCVAFLPSWALPEGILKRRDGYPCLPGRIRRAHGPFPCRGECPRADCRLEFPDRPVSPNALDFVEHSLELIIEINDQLQVAV